MARRKTPIIKMIAAMTVIFQTGVFAQNSVLLQMRDGSPITVFHNDTAVNKTPQTNVALHQLREDTLRLKVGVATGTKYEITLYLLDKGKKTAGKEFSYVIHREKYRLIPLFMGMR